MNKELLQLLACPRCRGELELKESNGQATGLACASCALLYPIRDDIPVMLVEEALPLASAEKSDAGDGACACS